MTWLIIFFTFLLTLSTTSTTATGHDAQDAEASMPACAANCMSSIIPVSTCSVNYLECVCNDSALRKEIGDCVSTNCTVREGIVIAGNTAKLCGTPIRSSRRAVDGITATFGVLAVTAVVMRMFVRLTGSNLWWDDFFVILATLAMIPIAVDVFAMTRVGLARDIAGVRPDDLTTLFFWYYLGEILYCFVTMCTKASILFFYRRVFGSQGISREIYTLLAFCGLVVIVFTFTIAFQCSPISLAWTNWEHNAPGACINVNAVIWAQNGVNVALDLPILILPIPTLLGLQLPKNQKVYVLIIFGLGFMITLAGILRLVSLVRFARTSNFTYDNAYTAIWTAIELNVGIICVCLPTLRPFLRLVRTRLFGVKDPSSNEGDVNVEQYQIRAQGPQDSTSTATTIEEWGRMVKDINAKSHVRTESGNIDESNTNVHQTEYEVE